MARSSDINNRILDYLKSARPRSQQEIAKAIGVSRETCRVHLKELVKSGQIIRSSYSLATVDNADLSAYVMVKTTPHPEHRRAVHEILATNPIVSGFNMVTGHDYDYVAMVNAGIRTAAMQQFVIALRDVDGTDTVTLAIIS